MNDELQVEVPEQIIGTIVAQHAEEAGYLWFQRSVAVRSPHFSFHNLCRHDERLAAHVDGLRIAGPAGSLACEAQLALREPGAMFATVVLALEAKRLQRIETLFSLAGTVPEIRSELTSAFGWVSREFLQGTAKELLGATSPFRRRVGIACCAMHQVDPGEALETAITAVEPALRARALRAVAELGRLDLLPLCYDYLRDQDLNCRFWAGWAGLMLGERNESIVALKGFTVPVAPFALCDRALQLLLKVLEVPQAHELLKSLARDPANQRLLLQGAGIAGDPYYVPWLIKQMDELKFTRLAGEAFSFVTGLDLAYLDLERKPPRGLEFGPTDNPEDEDVAMDPDDGLPWPDPIKIQKWWDANKHRFQPSVRYFMGEPVNVANCKRVLREGCQRQRIAAALYLSLLQPGTPLFPTGAPAWRQQRWFSRMT